MVESALYELLRYANKYSEQVRLLHHQLWKLSCFLSLSLSLQMLVNLRNAGLDQRATVFESVVRATM